MLFLGLTLAPTAQAVARDLTFEERVKAQEAIERVYYSHQIGATKPFEQAVPRGVLERRVRTYLKQSAALEELWHTPVTAEMLRSETERMARQTRMPERLRELYAALGGDSFLIQECLARPAIVDRLARNFFAYDRSIHDERRRDVAALREQLANGTINPWSEHPFRAITHLVRGQPENRGGPGERAEARHGKERHRSGVEVAPEEFNRYRARLPERIGEIGPVDEERDAFIVHVVLDRNEGEVRFASYVVRKSEWDVWWQSVEVHLEEGSVEGVATNDNPLLVPPTEGPEVVSSSVCQADDTWDNGSLGANPRTSHTAVWTGSLMIVWGGLVDSNAGSRYDPATDTWTPTSTIGAPGARSSHTAVWTGSLMVVWGGEYGAPLNTGGRYDPATDTWTPTSLSNAPSPRSFHTAVWTGSLMVVWGGFSVSSYLKTGARYDPTTDTWVPTSVANAPSARYSHSAVWAQDVMVVWAGFDGFSNLNSGGRYDPATDTWTPTSTISAPSPRQLPTAVWTGSMMVVWGGAAQTATNTGGRYDPATDSWIPTSVTNAPSPRVGHTAVWTGSLMVVWGGLSLAPIDQLNTGGRYDPATDSWIATSTTNAPSRRRLHTAVWTGSVMIVWGGVAEGLPSTNTGGRYNPATDTWTPTSTTSFPSPRSLHTGIWTGSLMVVWGGLSRSGSLNTGSRYDPATDTWTPTSTIGAPSPRQSHTAVWTGGSMVVWGGLSPSLVVLNTGGRYDPATDTWAPASITSAPSPRSLHTAIWTGRLMVVWGGLAGGSYLNSGGQYDPAADTWTPTSAISAPSARAEHTAAWAGNLMVVWGGSNGSSFLMSGGRYDPATDTWTPTSTISAPSARAAHTGAWTGNVLVVWGGVDDVFYVDTGGRYDPAKDTWTPTSIVGAPSPRAQHTVLWTGRLMVVWGGYPGRFSLNTGGRYDPGTDTWTITSPTNAPSARFNHTAIWTGSVMVVWGGQTGADFLNTGGRYAIGSSVDEDGDGFTVCQGDCEDSSPTVRPGATEICDGLDNNCDGQTDEGFQVGMVCVDEVDACHQVVGNLQCRSDGTGTRCSGDIVPHDIAPPTIVCPADLVLECPGTSGSIGHAVASDNCDPRPQIANNAPTALPLGIAAITWVAADISGNTSSCHQTVTVADTTPPQISLATSPTVLWPPNHRLVPVSVGWQVTDRCDPSPQVMVLSVTSDEPDDASGTGDGSTTGDIADVTLGMPESTVLLRAERAGDGAGRTYILTYSARDGSGNVSSAIAIVTVPHDLGSGPEPLLMNLEPEGALGIVHVYWNGVPGALMYDLIAGDLGQVTVLDGKLWLGPVRVLASGMTGTSYIEGNADAVPAVGRAFFYLVQYRDAQTASGWGTESGPWPEVPTSCDIGCPGDVSDILAASQTVRKK